MKKQIMMVVLLVSMLVLTACGAQTRVEIKIDTDQKATMEFLYALDDEAIDTFLSMQEESEGETQEEKTYTDEERWAFLENGVQEQYSGFVIKEKYNEDGFKGYRLTRELGTLEDISAEKASEEVTFDNLAEQDKIFVKKGNEYTIHIEPEKGSGEETTESAETVEMEDDGSFQEFVITLPKKAKSNNATTVSADGLTYTWDLTTAKSIELTYDPTAEVTEEPAQESSWSNASEWAVEELNKALEKELIPAIFENEDLTINITRKEFAHVAVKLWEKLSGQTMQPGPKNPFTDTEDPEVLKAYNLEITNGTSETTFSPDALITREQMATMMTRALSKAGIDTSVDLERVSKFADDDQMHDWGKAAIYYMSNIEIIKGVGENTFSVEGNATREQAILISERSMEKIGK